MTRLLPQRYRRAKGRPEVVALLVGDGSARQVAEAAADEARTRRRPVRFIVTASETDLLTLALRAVGAGPPVRPLVEVAAGDPLPLLVEGDLAARCLGVVDCPIRFVAKETSGTFDPAAPGGPVARWEEARTGRAQEEQT
jgi:hypothetical protein